MTSCREPVAAQQILESYRDLGGPSSRIDARWGHRAQLSCDPNFNRYASYWLTGPTIDSSFASLEAWRLTSSKEDYEAFLAGEGERIRRFLGDRYVQGGVFQCDGSPRTRGIFACYSALGVLKELAGIDGQTPLGAERFDASVVALGTSVPSGGASEAVVSLIRDAAEGSPILGTVLDRPASSLPPTLTVLYTVSSLLWNLYPEDPADRFFAAVGFPERTVDYVAACLKRATIGDLRMAGFSIHPDVEELCVNTTCFGLHLLRRLGLLETLIGDEESVELRRFLWRSFRDGGFGSTLSEEPSLNATFFGLRSLECLLSDEERSAFLHERSAQIAAFVADCCNDVTGGAAFSRDLGRYVENGLATRYAIQILGSLSDSSPLRDCLGRYCRHQYDPRVGAFRAYPRERVDLSVLSREDNWLERTLQDRDERLLDQLPGGDPKDRELRRVEREIEECFTRLARGRERGEDAPETTSTFERLRRLQAEEALLIRRRLHDSLELPLGAGPELLEQADRLLAAHAPAS